MSRASVECMTAVMAEDERRLMAHEVKAWLAHVPDGACVASIIKDFGSQRDPEPTLVGLRATWSEVR